jgi:hypothetical protein
MPIQFGPRHIVGQEEPRAVGELLFGSQRSQRLLVLDLSAPFPGWAVMLEDLPVASNAEVDRDKPSDRFGPQRRRQILSAPPRQLRQA